MSENLKDILGSIKEAISKNDDSIDSFLIDTEHWVELLDYITKLEQENEELEERIAKALEYIGSGKVKVMEYIDDFNTPIHTNWKLIEILKGDK